MGDISMDKEGHMKRYLWSFIAAIFVGVGLPLLEVEIACLRPSSESCVWGRALLPVNIAATLVIVGAPTFFLVLWAQGRKKG